MTKLRVPLHEALTERVDEATVQRIWQRVRARRQGESALLAHRSWRTWALAGVVLGLVVTFNSFAWRRPHPVEMGLIANGPLTTGAAALPPVLGSERASESDLSDGSRIWLDPGARLEVLENSGTRFVSVLRDGRASFSVRPGGPRHWTIEAGLATVEVVGTRFAVARVPDGVNVSVEHGVVLVRSDLIRDHVERLTAGQHLELRTPSVAAEANPAPAVGLGGPSSASPSEVTSSVPAVSASGTPPETAAHLLAQANDQRRSGDVRGAELSLRRVLAEHTDDPESAFAAFMLGKLLDSAGRSAEAGAMFARCLQLSPPTAIAEDALFRLAESQAKSGDLSAAASTASKYRARYPTGRHTRDVEQWLAH